MTPPDAVGVLRPCPFCGSEDTYTEVVAPHTHKVATFMPDYEGGAMATCGNCAAAHWRDGPNAEAEVTAAWNRRAAIEAMEWRPIESAPRTGIAVLLWQPWKSGRDCAVIGHYANGWTARDCEEMHPEPTHWMPLPAPPAAADGRTNEEKGE